jgi:hypothetical protein
MEPPTVTCSGSCTVTQAVGVPSAQDYVDLGFSTDHIMLAMGFGLGFVLLLWSFGYVASLGVSLIRKL